jgi:hypothetical protein
MIIIWVITIIVIIFLYIYSDSAWYHAGKPVKPTAGKPVTQKPKPVTQKPVKPSTQKPVKPVTKKPGIANLGALLGTKKPIGNTQKPSILLNAKNKKTCDTKNGVWLNSVKSCVSQSAQLSAKDSKSCSSKNGVWIDKTCLSASSIPQDAQRRRRFFDDGPAGQNSGPSVTLYGANGKPMEISQATNPLKPNTVYTMKDGTSWQVDSTGTHVAECSSKPDHSEFRYAGGGFLPCRGRGSAGNSLVQDALNAVRGQLPGGQLPSTPPSQPQPTTQRPSAPSSNMTIQEYTARMIINSRGTYEDMVKRYGTKVVSRAEFNRLQNEIYGNPPPYNPSPGNPPPYVHPPPYSIPSRPVTFTGPVTAGTIASDSPLAPLVTALVTSPTAVIPTYASTALVNMQNYLNRNPPPLQRGTGLREWMTSFLDQNNTNLYNIARWRSSDPRAIQNNPVGQMIVNYINTNMGGSQSTWWRNVNTVNANLFARFQESPHYGMYNIGQGYGVDDLFPNNPPQM